MGKKSTKGGVRKARPGAPGGTPKLACLGRAMGLRKFYGDLMGMGPSHSSA
jgi:hypothetical protein